MGKEKHVYVFALRQFLFSGNIFLSLFFFCFNTPSSKKQSFAEIRGCRDSLFVDCFRELHGKYCERKKLRETHFALNRSISIKHTTLDLDENLISQ